MACKNDEIYIPKPRMYPRIIFPEKGYQAFNVDDCPFRFDYPIYAEIEKDKKFFNEEAPSPCWYDIVIPSFNGRIHCSYYSIADRTQLDGYIDDAFRITGSHNQKANYRDELVIEKGDVGGILFDIQGEVASPVQFFVTDSVDHYLRGALYFYNQVETDSMAPIYEFVKQDIAHMLETFEWKR